MSATNFKSGLVARPASPGCLLMRADGRRGRRKGASHKTTVAVRIRPPTGQLGGGGQGVEIVGGNVEVGGVSFAYADAVIQGSDQGVAFASLATSMLRQLDEGYSVTLLAYGQTGSGKTHTMFGPPGSLSEAALARRCEEEAPEDWGVFPRCMMHLLRLPGFGSMHASAVEVYQETAFDLLNGRSPLKVGKSKTDAVGSGKVVVGKVRQMDRKSGWKGNDTQEEFMERERATARKKAEMAARREAAQIAIKRGSRTVTSTSTGGGVGGVGGASSGKRASNAGGAASGGRGGGRGGGQGGSGADAAFATVGETVQAITCDADIARLARLVEATRVAHGHALNARSSRSHCLVHVHVTTKSADGATFRRRYEER